MGPLAPEAYFTSEPLGRVTNLSWLAWDFLHFKYPKSCILRRPQCWENWGSWLPSHAGCSLCPSPSSSVCLCLFCLCCSNHGEPFLLPFTFVGWPQRSAPRGHIPQAQEACCPYLPDKQTAVPSACGWSVGAAEAEPGGGSCLSAAGSSHQVLHFCLLLCKELQAWGPVSLTLTQSLSQGVQTRTGAGIPL